MPSHKIHMYIAKKVNEKLKLDLDSIMLGSVLPDLTINKNHENLIISMRVLMKVNLQIQINLYMNINQN